MSEEIARVVRDLKAHRVHDPALSAASNDEAIVSNMRVIHDNLIELIRDFPCQVIDASSMYEQIMSGPPVKLYDDFRLLPVWENALIGYENQNGNVYVVQTYCIDKEDEHWETYEWKDKIPPYGWETPNEIDWEKIKYRFVGVLWAGGRHSNGKHLPTIGPLYRWDVAVYPEGELGDIRWSALYDFGGDEGQKESLEFVFQNAMLIWFQTYTLAGCSNVEIVTPQRPKYERKRIERTGVNPQKIIIKKTSKSYRYQKGDTDKVIGGVPQGFVRGHYARYGPEYDRGLLFGKYSGKFWHPARAVAEVNREIDYQVEAS